MLKRQMGFYIEYTFFCLFVCFFVVYISMLYHHFQQTKTPNFLINHKRESKFVSPYVRTLYPPQDETQNNNHALIQGSYCNENHTTS